MPAWTAWPNRDGRSPFVVTAPEGRKQEAVPGILRWYERERRTSIDASAVYFFDDKQKRYFSITRGCSYTRFYDGRVAILPLGFDYRVTVSSRASVCTIDVTTAFAWRDAWRAGGGLVDGFAPTAQDRAAKTAPHVAAETRIILIKNLLEEARRFSDPDAHAF